MKLPSPSPSSPYVRHDRHLRGDHRRDLDDELDRREQSRSQKWVKETRNAVRIQRDRSACLPDHIFPHLFPSKTVRLTTTAGVSRVIIIDEGKRGKSSNTSRSILHASTNDTKNHSNSCPRCIDDNNNSNDNNDNSRRNSSSGIVGENLSNLTVLVRSTISRPS